MSLFDIEFELSHALENYLRRLKTKVKSPSLSYLNELIHSHHENIPFENFTRIIEFFECDQKFPTIEEY